MVQTDSQKIREGARRALLKALNFSLPDDYKAEKEAEHTWIRVSHRTVPERKFRVEIKYALHGFAGNWKVVGVESVQADGDHYRTGVRTATYQFKRGADIQQEMDRIALAICTKFLPKFNDASIEREKQERITARHEAATAARIKSLRTRLALHGFQFDTYNDRFKSKSEKRKLYVEVDGDQVKIITVAEMTDDQVIRIVEYADVLLSVPRE